MSDTLIDQLKRLAESCAQDDARALAAPWIWTDETFLWNVALDHGVLAHGNTNWPVSIDNREVIAAARNRLPELARVLADAAKRIDLLESLAIQDGEARDQLRKQVVAAERERDQAIIDHRDALDQWEAEVNVAVADETKVLRDQLAAMTASREEMRAYAADAKVSWGFQIEMRAQELVERDALKVEIERLRSVISSGGNGASAVIGEEPVG